MGIRLGSSPFQALRARSRLSKAEKAGIDIGMAHYALINLNGLVLLIIIVRQAFKGIHHISR